MNSSELTRIPEYFGILGFILWAMSERWFQLSRNQQEKGDKKDQGTLLLISLFWYSTVIVSVIDANSVYWTTIDIPIKELRWLGIPIIIIGLTVRIIARQTLKKQYSAVVKTSESHELITTGIYRKLRHPAYLGLVMLLLGIPLSSWSMLGLGIGLLGGVPAILYRIKVEESFLAEIFGQKYKDYSENTWKIIPYLW